MDTGIWIVRPEALGAARVLAQDSAADILGAVPGSAHKAGSLAAFHAVFRTKTRWILLMASGIATRYLSGLPASKQSDPAVVVVDEMLRFAVPILGGHEAGANNLAYEIARSTGAVPVITTATEALKPLTLGIGCRKGVSAGTIGEAVQSALGEAGFSLAAIREAATVDRKAAEPGLLEWTRREGIPLRIFSTAQLAQRPWAEKPSEWVRRQLGLAGVCEPCALLASVRGELVVKKTSLRGVSVALVADSCPGQPLSIP